MKKVRHVRHPIHLAGLITSIGALTVVMSLTTTTQLWDTAKIMTASATVGAVASVEPNPDNTLAQQFAEKERMLAEREVQIAQLEQAQRSLSSSDMLALSSGILSFVLLILVGLNFYFDFHRRLPPVFSVDLRRS